MVPTWTQGRRSSGVAATAVSLTSAVGVFWWSTMTMARALAASARLMASATGRSAGTAMARLASVLAVSAGSLALILAALIDCPDWIQMKAAIITSQRRL